MFEVEATPYFDEIHRAAVRLSGNEYQADDLMQEAMLKACRSWNTNVTNIRPWLFAILRNTFINEYHKQRIRPTQVKLQDGVGTTNPDFFDNIIDEEVLQAIDQLPDFLKDTFTLHVDGFTYHEISDMLNVSIGTVKSRLFRARQSLQEKLYDYATEIGYIKNG